jgi:hypothetical protein
VKRIHIPDLSCLFCSELESVHHLFFDCFVAKIVWSTISDLLGVCVGVDFESVARWWLVVVELDQWKILSKNYVVVSLSEKARLLNKKRGEVLRIAWN